MKGQIIQVLGDSVEELYWVAIPEEEFCDKFENWWKEWDDTEKYEEGGYESFEDWMEANHPEVEIERVFVTEIYV